jgi:hypothetical protein
MPGRLADGLGMRVGKNGVWSTGIKRSGFVAVRLVAIWGVEGDVDYGF